MIQKCSLLKVFSIFCEEPLEIHYIKEISKKIDLAPTSVRNHLAELLQQNIINKKKGERFIGFIANRDNEDFLFYKKIINLINIKESGLIKFIIDSIYPQAIIIYGSYLRGEDIKDSDIDIFILTKVKKRLNFEKFEKILKRRIHILSGVNIKDLPLELKLEINNGFVLYGYLKNE